MKLYSTENSFLYGVQADAIEGGFRFTLFQHYPTPDDPERLMVGPVASLEITEGMVRKHLGPHGMTDMCHVYVELDSKNPSQVRVFNRAVSTYLDKRDGSSYALNAQCPVLAQIYIPFKDSPASDWVIRVNANPDVKADFPVGTPKTGATSAELHDFAVEIYPSLSVLSVGEAQDGVKEIRVQLVDGAGNPIQKAGVRVDARGVAGYVNKTEAVTDATGLVVFRARRLDLDPGDEMVVEFGFKFWTNLSKAHV